MIKYRWILECIINSELCLPIEYNHVHKWVQFHFPVFAWHHIHQWFGCTSVAISLNIMFKQFLISGTSKCTLNSWIVVGSLFVFLNQRSCFSCSLSYVVFFFLCWHFSFFFWQPFYVSISFCVFFSWLNMLNKCWCYFSKLSVYEGVESFYKEEDEIVPVNMYGKSKVAAEQFISANWPSFAILRSSIIYGPQTVSPVTKSLPIQVQMIVPFFIYVFMLDICPAWVKVLRWL